MKFESELWHRTGRWVTLCLLSLGLAWTACAQTVTTTTVQGTVYQADGAAASGMVQLSWPAFNAPGGGAVAAGQTTATIGTDGFFSVNLAPNLGSTPAGLFYTAVYHLSDGTTSTEYWVVPAAAQATLAQVRAKVMPAAQAVQAVSKAYVDQAIQSLAEGSLSPAGGTLSSPLYLAGDPVQPLEAADKHYVDASIASALPVAGGGTSGTVNTGSPGQIAYYGSNGNALSGMSVVPVSAGGTGAATAAAALAALGGASLTSAAAQLFAGPVNSPAVSASVNHVLLVTAPPYNATCDGTTDDHAAVQAAFDDAWARGFTVQFPAGTCLTSTIIWKGQSFFGAGVSQTTIKGMPGQDVFATPDTSGSLRFGATVHDFTLLVDNTLNAAATAAGGNNTFPNRISGTSGGTTALDNPPETGPLIFEGSDGNCTGSISSGSTTLTIPCATFQNATPELLIGRPITVTGAGVSGGTLYTTVASIMDATHLALATAASTTSSTATVTAGTGPQAPWYFGNCGIAMPGSDGAALEDGLNGWIFRNLQIENINGVSRSNYSCGIFTQANTYAFKYENVDIMNLWGGLIEAPPASNEASYFAWTPDTATYTNLNLKFNVIPIVLYNGGHRVFNGISIYGGNVPFSLGMFWFADTLGSSGTRYPSGSMTQYYDECWTPNSGEQMRIEGPTNIHGGSLSQCNGENQYIIWAGSNSKVDAQIGSELQIYGTANEFTNLGVPTVPVDDEGYANSVLGQDNGGGVSSLQAVKTYLNRPHAPTNGLDSGFLLSGNSATPYESGADLVVPCDEFNFVQAPVYIGCTQDPSGTEITRSYAALTPGVTTGISMQGQTDGSGRGPYGKRLIVGDRLPQSKVTMVVLGRCVTASCVGQSWYIYDYNGSTTATLVSGTLAFGTSWTVQKFAFDLSSVPLGDVIGVGANNLYTGGASEFDLALIGFQPWNNDVAAQILSGNSTVFANKSTAEQDVVIQPGSDSDQIGAFGFNNHAAVSQWKLRKDAGNTFRATDSANNLDRAILYQNGQTILNAGSGANAVVLNGNTNSGTGGLVVQSGGSSPSTVLTVTGIGNTTATGFVAGQFMMGSGTMTFSAGSAAGTGSSLSCATSHVCDGVSGTAAFTTGTSPSTGLLATLGFPNTHSNKANCVVTVSSSTAQLTNVTWSESTTALVLTANSALTATTPYTVRYWCGGN